MADTEANPFLLFIRRLEALNAPYMVTGSVASTLYGEPRLTNDVDIVVEIDRRHCEAIADLFPLEEFYCPPREVLIVEAGRAQRGHFNLIHHDTGFKADIYPVGRDRLARWGLANRRMIEVEGLRVAVAPPEYVILRKLQFYVEGGSEKHLGDVRGMLAGPDVAIDRTFIEEHADRLGVRDAWERVAGADSPGS
ncbi:hypothetical protein L6Q96_15595 [Candidatus Binatia bacterium]|nr:hypothetical protein [Candidatus Binatia bacterium]